MVEVKLYIEIKWSKKSGGGTYRFLKDKLVFGLTEAQAVKQAIKEFRDENKKPNEHKSRLQVVEIGGCRRWPGAGKIYYAAAWLAVDGPYKWATKSAKDRYDAFLKRKYAAQ